MLLAVAAGLVLLTGDDGATGFTEQATATCETYDQRVRDEYDLTFPEGPPTPTAEAEYLARAFADTIDRLVADLRAIEGSEDAADAIDAMEARTAEIRADPEPFVAARENPFVTDVAPLFDAVDLSACGSDFLGGQE